MTDKPEEIAAFIELHIEQGPVLEQNQKDIGIVDAIVSLECYDVLVRGRAEHAGTTPIDMRADALLAAAKAIAAATGRNQQDITGRPCRHGYASEKDN